MLEALRKGTASWIAKIFIGLLVLSFAVWGIADIFGGYGAQTVATVGDSEISSLDYSTEFQREVRGLSNRLGREVTYDDARSYGLDKQILLRLIGDAAIQEQANALGLGISAKAVAARIRREAAFKDESGRFSQERFFRLLQANNLSEQAFLERQRRALVLEQITGTVTGSAAASKTLIDAVDTYRNETRKLSYISVPLEKFGGLGEPTAEQLRDFYSVHKSEFVVPEIRKVGTIVVTPDEVAKKIEVGEDELKTYYETNKNRFGRPERRAVQQITFPDEASANEAYEKLMAGAEMMEIATARGLSEKDVDLGLVPKSALLDDAVADAVFALPVDELSKPIKGQLATVIAKVTKIEPAVVRTLDDEREAIRKLLTASRAATAILDTYDKIEDERAAGETLAEIARKLDLKYVEVAAVDSQGRDADGNPVDLLAKQPAVLRAIFSAGAGVETDPEETSDRGFIWYEVQDVKSERQKAFEEATNEIEAKWRESEERKTLARKGQELVDRLRGGESLAAVADGLGVEVKESGALKRTVSDSALPAAAIQQAFTLSEGAYGSASAEERRARVIFQVTEVKTPSRMGANADAGLAKSLKPAIGDDLIVQYVRALRDTYGVNVNQGVFEEATTGRSPATDRRPGAFY